MGGKNRKWNTFYEETKNFKNISEVKNYIEENYPKCKRVKMYQDKKDGTPYQVGWIYCFKNYEWEDGKKLNYYQQDWLSISKVRETIINLK